jgi:hypothetical protein
VRRRDIDRGRRHLQRCALRLVCPTQRPVPLQAYRGGPNRACLEAHAVCATARPHNPVPRPSAQHAPTTAGQTSKAACLDIQATATNPSNKPLYNADVFGRVYDALGEAAIDDTVRRRGSSRGGATRMSRRAQRRAARPRPCHAHLSRCPARAAHLQENIRIAYLEEVQPGKSAVSFKLFVPREQFELGQVARCAGAASVLPPAALSCTRGLGRKWVWDPAAAPAPSGRASCWCRWWQCCIHTRLVDAGRVSGCRRQWCRHPGWAVQARQCPPLPCSACTQQAGRCRRANAPPPPALCPAGP